MPAVTLPESKRDNPARKLRDRYSRLKIFQQIRFACKGARISSSRIIRAANPPPKMHVDGGEKERTFRRGLCSPVFWYLGLDVVNPSVIKRNESLDRVVYGVQTLTIEFGRRFSANKSLF